MFFREQDERVDKRTIVEYLDPIQFLMPYQDCAEKKFENLTKSEFLEIVNEVLNFSSENLRNYSSLMTDAEFFEELDEDLIQALYILLIEDYLLVKHKSTFN